MILDIDEFKRVEAYCQQLLQNMAAANSADCFQLGITIDAAISVYQQMYARRMKKMTPTIENDISNISQRVSEGELLFEIAKEKRFSPYKLAKIYSKYHMSRDFSLSKVWTDPPTEHFTDARVAADVIRCCMEDPFSSQTADSVGHCMGKEYEELLYHALREKCICFETESELRLQGKPKTPDALLLFPMAVRVSESEDWQIVHWIDSKAMFGDVETFDEHLEQLHGYVNRYGKGLVIYWHGLARPIMNRSPSIVAIDRFPDKWLFPCDL